MFDKCEYYLYAEIYEKLKNIYNYGYHPINMMWMHISQPFKNELLHHYIIHDEEFIFYHIMRKYKPNNINKMHDIVIHFN